MIELRKINSKCLRPNMMALNLPREKVMRELLPPGIR